MHVSGGEFKDGSGYVEGNRSKDDRVEIKFKADTDVEGCGAYSGSGCDDSFCAFSEVDK